MSSSTIFIALQCCQCSTMQVKQKKKSRNKWSCAVCNQKQSVRKVFAQGLMAKQIRMFVQSFNMSRKSLDDDAGTLEPAPPNPTKKRTDWSPYLDQEDHHITQEQEKDGDDFEPLVLTELQKGMFKKRRLVENSSGLGGEGSDKLYKKPFSPNSHEGPTKDQRRTSFTQSNSERNNYVTPDNRRTQKCKPAISKAASKWNDYATEDNDNLELRWEADFKDHSCPWNNSVLEAITSDQRVEDDIHPDFL